MAYIDFEHDWPETHICDEGGSGNTLVDAANGVRFIIAEGSMWVTETDGNHTLYFSRGSCGAEVRDEGIVVIRFDEPQAHLSFEVSHSPDYTQDTRVTFYRDHHQVGQIESRTVPYNQGQYNQVYYRDLTGTAKVREIVIRTTSSENNLDNLSFHRWAITTVWEALGLTPRKLYQFTGPVTLRRRSVVGVASVERPALAELGVR
jgi:hypothetical protein